MAVKIETEPAFDPKTATFAASAAQSGKREIRSLPIQEFRVEKVGDRTYFTGVAAVFNSLSEDLGGWRERILPGAFSSSLKAKPEIHHLFNHDESMILGNTASGTTELIEDETGLRFRTLAGNRSYERDLIESMERKDIRRCSFAFAAVKQKWVDEPDPEKRGVTRMIRELEEVSLYDVSIVSRPAYTETSAELSSRAMFPDGVPIEIRSHTQPLPEPPANPAAQAEDTCQCDCASCETGACANCSNTECIDSNCEDCPYQNSLKNFKHTPGYIAAIRLVRSAKVVPELGVRELRAASNADGILTLFVYEDIGMDCWGGGVNALGVKQQIDEAGTHEKIRVRINSMGGDVFEAVAIHNLLRAQGKPIETCVDGMAASAASVIAMAGDTITMGGNCMMMIHNASSGAYGYASDFHKEADVLDKVSGAIAQTYVKATKKSKTYIKDLMDAETWMTAADCIKDGFATGFSKSEPADEERMLDMVASSPLCLTYRNLPERFKVETRTAKQDAEKRAKEIEEQETAERERFELRRRAVAASL